MMKSSIQLSPSGKHLENMGKMFRKLYRDEQLTDVTLCCKDGSIRAHKVILATCSPYFHRIFTENNVRADHPLVIMHGVPFQHLHDLIELIYKGNVEVLPESLNSLYELAGEFQLSGISGTLREDNSENHKQTSSETLKNNEGSHGRDTRFKGMKRVAVDYTEFQDNNSKITKKSSISDNNHPMDTQIINADKNAALSETSVMGKNIEEIFTPTLKPSVPIVNTTEEEEEEDDTTKAPQLEKKSLSNNEESPKLSAWAKKQRKFKCEICPSSFKRSSHLTRHQLVHTGERPYACTQCDKAFSRHDKLKHHVRKAHEHDYETDYGLEITADTVRETSPLPFIISQVGNADHSSPELGYHSTAKRPRGRPRKHPICDKPGLKRGRGRPRTNPMKHGDNVNGENYDITNLPYGDLDYLTMPLQQCEDSAVMIEPYVEIQTDSASAEKDEENETESAESKIDGPEHTIKENEYDRNVEEDLGPNTTSLKVLENKIAEIGECTISVANH